MKSHRRRRLLYAALPFMCLFVICAFRGYAMPQGSGTASATYVIRPETKEVKSRYPRLLASRQVKRPRLALVLSGGGARGVATIGVLKVLERHSIPIDLIVGTSMGSIIGGLYASGYSTHQLEMLADTTNWPEVLSYSDEARRKDMFLDQKLASDRSILVIRFDGFLPIIPASYSTGQRLTNYLNVLALQGIYHPGPSFDDLRIPFRAVTTDLLTGRQVVLDHGDLSQALRASMSVPLLFSTVKQDSMELVDGGLVSNLPVDVARRSGADIVVSVDVTSPLRPPSMLKAPWEIGDQIMGIMMQLSNKLSRERSDVVITPELGSHLSSDFGSLDSLIRKGEEATETAIPFLEAAVRAGVRHVDGTAQERLFTHLTVREPVELNDREDVERLRQLVQRGHVTTSDVQDFVNEVYGRGQYSTLTAIVEERTDSASLALRSSLNPTLRSVDISGNQVLQTDSLLAVFRDQLNRPINPGLMSKAIEDLLAIYRDGGYSLARVTDASFDSTTGRATVRVNEGVIYRIEIRGTQKTRDYLIWRELPFTEGDVFRVSRLKQGIANLYGTNLFEQVIVSIEHEGVRDELTTVVLGVRERSTKLIRLGLRVDSERSIQPSIDIRDENFLGMGFELGARAFGGPRNQSYIAEFKATRIFNSYFTLAIRGYSLIRDVNVYGTPLSNDPLHFDRVREGEYRTIRSGGSATFGTQLERLGSVTLEGRLENQKVANIFNTPITNQNYGFSSVKVGTTIDTQDKIPFPTEGVALHFSYESALVKLVEAEGFTKIDFSYDFYKTFYGRHTIHPRFQFGLADMTLPITEQFSLGGLQSFFGLNEDDSRGRQLFLASLEYQYRLPVKIVFETYVKARYDIGHVWLKPEEIRLVDLQHGLGVGIGFDTPIGPAEFAVGRSFYIMKDFLDNPLSLGPFVGYFSLGFAF